MIGQISHNLPLFLDVTEVLTLRGLFQGDVIVGTTKEHLHLAVYQEYAIVLLGIDLIAISIVRHS